MCADGMLMHEKAAITIISFSASEALNSPWIDNFKRLPHVPQLVLTFSVLPGVGSD